MQQVPKRPKPQSNLQENGFWLQAGILVSRNLMWETPTPFFPIWRRRLLHNGTSNSYGNKPRRSGLPQSFSKSLGPGLHEKHHAGRQPSRRLRRRNIPIIEISGMVKKATRISRFLAAVHDQPVVVGLAVHKNTCSDTLFSRADGLVESYIRALLRPNSYVSDADKTDLGCTKANVRLQLSFKSVRVITRCPSSHHCGPCDTPQYYCGQQAISG